MTGTLTAEGASTSWRGMRITCRLAALALLLAAAQADARRGAAPFPDGFLWGTAISGFQSDMGLGAPTDPNSDWWVWVRDPQNLSSGAVSGDLPEDGPGHWLRFAADAKLARRKLRLNAQRLGIEWSRLFPTSTAGVDTSGGIGAAELAALDALADQSAVAHYRAVFEALRRRGLEPMVTLGHFTLPTWIHDPVAVRAAYAGVDPFAGPVPAVDAPAGWLDPATVGEFEKLAAYAAWKFGDLVDLWCTLNEPVVVVVSGWINAPGVGGNFPPGVFHLPSVPVLLPNLVRAHARAYDALHAHDQTDADGDGVAVAAGVVHNMGYFAPANPDSAADVAATAHAEYLFDTLLPEAVVAGRIDLDLDGDTTGPGEMDPTLAGRSDFLGVNYYQRIRVTALPGPLSASLPLFDFLPTITYQSPAAPDAPPCPSECTDFGWEIAPEGLRRVLELVAPLGVPIYVTENGIADAADAQRARYTVRHLAVLQQTIADGVADVRGYFHWSLTDNFEWASGYQPKFGLFAYDVETGKRRRRKSAKVLRAIAKRNGIPAKLLRRFGE